MTRTTGLRLGLAGLAVLLLVASVLAFGAQRIAPGLLPGSWTSAERVEDRNRDVLTATRRTMEVFLDVDYRTIDEQIEDLLGRSTGQFAKEFDSARVEYAALTRQGEAVTTGDIREIGITDANDKVVKLSVAADSEVTNKATEEAVAKGEKVDKTRVYYFQVTMTKVGDEWLMSKLEVLG